MAVTVVAAETVTEQAPVPEQPPPLQPVKAEPAAGLAARAMTVPLGTVSVQSAPQLMTVVAPWVPVTVPLPVPALAAVSVNVGVKVAVTVVAAETVTEQGPVPEQPPPLQPVKAESAAGVAVRTMTVPLGTVSVHRRHS